MQGCCSYGAHFIDEADVAAWKPPPKTLTADEWQFRDGGKEG